MADTKISAASRLTGTGKVQHPVALAGSTTAFAIQNNYEATTNPGASDDNTEGYSIGSTWLNKTTGQQWVAVAVGTDAALWSQMNQYGITPFDLAFNTAYAGIEAPSFAQDAQDANTLYMTPLLWPVRRTLTKLAIARGAAVSGNARIGIYTVGAAGMPGALIVDGGEVSTNDTGIVEATVSLDLPAGRYWGAVVFSAAANVTRVSGNFNALGVIDSGTTVAAINGIKRSMTYGALGADESGGTFSQNTATIWIGIR